MLTGLVIQDVVLIERLDLDVAAGFTCMTGETGAGKSIILDALGLALGGRGDRGLVRAGAERAQATAMFAPPRGHAVRLIADEAGLELEDAGEIILRRAVGLDGRTRAYVNDEPVSVGSLKAIGDALVEVHGQHDGRGLLDPKTHRATLDAFGGCGPYAEAVARAWGQRTAAQAALADLAAGADRARAERDALAEAVAELDSLDPRADEEAGLAAERRLLQNAERALADLQAAVAALDGDGGFEARASAALRALDRTADIVAGVAAEDDDGPASLVRRAGEALDKALIEAEEARAALARALDAFEVEPGRLDRVEERLFALRAAARRHRVEVGDLPALRVRLTAALAAAEGGADTLERARETAAAADAAYRAAADALTAARRAAAERLDAAVARELPPLKLDRARFRTELTPLEPDRAGPEGQERVRFTVCTNPGAGFGNLDDIASGGELSRFALAIKVALSEVGGAHVFIFDEVDQGVGGAVAAAIGRRLADLARAGQVLVVTHSAQVAARADFHFKIEKTDTPDGVRTRVRELAGAERDEEIARMLAGETVTDAARAAARALIGG